MKDSFDIKRLWLLLRWGAVANWKRYATFFFGTALVVFLILEFSMFDVRYGSGSGRLMANKVDAVAGSFMFFWGALAVLCPSFVCSSLRDKRQATAFFSLPATLAEKFIVNYACATAGLLATALASLLLADGLHFVSCLAFGPHDFHSLFASAMGKMGWWLSGDGLFSAAAKGNGGMLVAVVLLHPLLAHAYFLLCGTLFLRKAWLVGTLLLLSLAFMFGGAGPRLWFDAVRSAEDSVAASAVVAALMLALVAAFYLLAYRVFCRTQIVGRKWVNL